MFKSSLSNFRLISHNLSIAILLYSLVAAQPLCLPAVCEPEATRITFSQLPQKLQDWLSRQGTTQKTFPAYLDSLSLQTSRRELEGEFDHLIFFALQSSRFTKLLKIEPARSAYELVQSLDENERASFFLKRQNADNRLVAKIPDGVRLRLQDFINILTQNNSDERLKYFKKFITANSSHKNSLLLKLSQEYLRSMSFLYEKEFGSSEDNTPQKIASHVSSLYQERGHSTDTQIEANFAIHQALASIKALEPERKIQNVLIIGPGQDFAPRTDFIDTFEPQSYQPFAVADALLRFKFSDMDSLRIHCVDINARVIDYLQSSSGKPITLSIISGLADRSERPLSEEFKQYFQSLGQQIGVESKLNSHFFSNHLQKTLQIKSEATSRITSGRLNIISHRYAPSPNYDLVIITNVFPYFNQIELSLAITNIAAMMKENGYLLHNEDRPELQSFALLNGIPATQSRTALIAGQQHKALFDGVVIHQKIASKK